MPKLYFSNKQNPLGIWPKKSACIIYQRNEICVFVEIGKQFCFDQGFLITQLKGGESSKHEIENAQQEFPRPCDIYRTKYVDFLKSC